MARGLLISLATLLAPLLWLAPAAHARTACPSEQSALTVDNGAEVSAALVCLTNQIRGHYGLPALRRDARLDTSARLHSEDMDRRDYFSHTTPEGLTSAARTAAQGYPARGTGENIAFGYPDARAVVLAWMQSAGHCTNILSDATDIGIGVSAVSKTYYTQNLGDFSARADRRRATPARTRSIWTRSVTRRRRRPGQRLRGRQPTSPRTAPAPRSPTSQEPALR